MDNQAQISAMAIRILQQSKDGDALASDDLWLLQGAVNGQLNERGYERFASLHEEVCSGEYARRHHWLHGIEGLTREHSGYIKWRGKTVEHYSFNDADAERAGDQRQLQPVAPRPPCGGNPETPSML